MSLSYAASSRRTNSGIKNKLNKRTSITNEKKKTLTNVDFNR